MFPGLDILKTSKKIWCWIALTLVLSFPAAVHAEGEFSPSELDTLVSTIALYPDPLLVQVLAASVHGDEIPGAADWASQHKNLKGPELAKAIANEDLPYDKSVQALIPFPTVLSTMAKYQVWTDQLGDAVSMQKDDVMDAVQRMRNAAYSHGHLQSNDQVKVIKEKTIIIEPVQKEYVYVPVYNPHVVYYVYSNGYPGLRYRSGVWIGGTYTAWGWGTSWFEWDTHLIYVHDYRWHHHRHAPRRPHRYAPPPPKDRHQAPPRDRYVAPPSHPAPAKVPMNHHNAPMSKGPQAEQRTVHQPTYHATRADIEQASFNAQRIKAPHKANYNGQEDYYEQNRNQGNQGNQGYGNVTSTRSSDRSRNTERSNSNGGNRTGFGKSFRK